MALVLAILAFVLSAVAAVLAFRTWRRVAPDDGLDVPSDVVGLRSEVARLKQEAARSLRHLAVVRYDAFEAMGGRLSWSLAVLDDQGDGVVLTSIHGRSEARTYAKSIAGWRSEQELSPEEAEAVTSARDTDQ